MLFLEIKSFLKYSCKKGFAELLAWELLTLSGEAGPGHRGGPDPAPRPGWQRPAYLSHLLCQQVCPFF